MLNFIKDFIKEYKKDKASRDGWNGYPPKWDKNNYLYEAWLNGKKLKSEHKNKECVSLHNLMVSKKINISLDYLKILTSSLKSYSLLKRMIMSIDKEVDMGTPLFSESYDLEKMIMKKLGYKIIESKRGYGHYTKLYLKIEIDKRK